MDEPNPKPAPPHGDNTPAQTDPPTPAPAEAGPVSEAGKKPPRPAGKPRETAAGRAVPKAPQFAPKDLTDGREPLDWQSNYDSAARYGIRCEAAYLATLFVVVVASLLLVWRHSPAAHFGGGEARVCLSQTMTNYMLAWVGGTLGGTLFSTKWLYHSVAKKIWHEDRRLWRCFTPHLSGALAFATYVMVTCGLFPVLEKKSLETDAMALSFGFIVGYFSDGATAKMTEVADTLFGSNRK